MRLRIDHRWVPTCAMNETGTGMSAASNDEGSIYADLLRQFPSLDLTANDEPTHKSPADEEESSEVD